jgi:hypothetical protein
MTSDSGNGFTTKVWGPILWTFLHIISFNYPVNPTEQDKANYFTFMMTLGTVLPCGKCRKNYLKNLVSLNFSTKDLKNRASFSNFVYRLHTHVNRLTEGSFAVSFQDLRDNFELFRARSCHANDTGHRGCTSSSCKLIQYIVHPDSSKAQDTFSIDEACRQ